MEKTRNLKFFVLLAAVLIAVMLAAGCARQAGEEGLSGDNLTGIEVAEEPAAGEGVTGSVVEETTPEETVAAKTDKNTIVVYEGELVSLKLKGTDADGDPITYTFSPPLDSTGKWQTKKGDKGTYNVQVSATDGKTVTTKNLQLIVKEENKAPVLEDLEDINVKVGDEIFIDAKAADPNNDELKFSYSGWMTSAKKEATEEDVGTHNVKVTVSDGQLEDSDTVVVTVTPLNAAPVMEKIPDITVKEGETITFNPKVVDPEGDKITITYDGWMKTNSYTTTYSDSGNYAVKITASDGQLSTTQTVEITVLDVNRAPEFDIEIG